MCLKKPSNSIGIFFMKSKDEILKFGAFRYVFWYSYSRPNNLFIVIKMMAKAHMSHKQAVAKVTLKVLLLSWAPIV